MSHNHLSERISIGALFVVAAVAAVVFGVIFSAPRAHAAGSQWTGCYGQVGGAYSMADTKSSVSQGVNSASIDGLGMQGVGLYGQVGCDVELVPHWVVGAFGSYTWDNNADFSVNTSFIPGDIVKASLKDQWAVGGRVGRVIYEKTLVYVLAGYTQADLSDISFPAFPKSTPLSTPSLQGYLVGGGVDVQLDRGWFLEAQGTFSKFQKADIALGSGLGAPVLGLDTDVLEARVGLGYKFNWSEPALPFAADRPLK